MKKKILLVGNISEFLVNIQNALDDEYDVQLCLMQKKSMQGMIKVLNPALIVICTLGVYDKEPGLLSWLDRDSGEMPVLFIALKDECNEFMKVCLSKRYTYLTLPADLDEIVKKSNELANAEPVRSKKTRIKSILIIDDSPVTLRYIKNELKDYYNVLLATDGAMGVKKAHESKPDLILLDYEMPGMDGRETFLNLKVDEETENIPVIFLTGVSDKKKVQEVLSMQPAGYMLKPVEAEQLVEKVYSVIGE
ncbi:MAG: response regulator [Lachnospiraceae bacterium]|nr:response regulator [Lachnospiraceae bacterium]